MALARGVRAPRASRRLWAGQDRSRDPESWDLPRSPPRRSRLGPHPTAMSLSEAEWPRGDEEGGVPRPKNPESTAQGEGEAGPPPTTTRGRRPDFPTVPSPIPISPPPPRDQTHPPPGSRGCSLSLRPSGFSRLRTLQLTPACYLPSLRFSLARRPLPSASPWSRFVLCRLCSAPPRLQEETSCSGAKSPGREIAGK